MHLECAGLAQHPDEGALGVAAHDRVIDDDQPFAADDLFERVELEPDAELSDGLGRLDEGAPHIGVLHQALTKRDARLLGVADRGRCARLRHTDHQVGLDRFLPGQPAADVHPGAVHRAPGDNAVRASEVDVLEDAALGCGRGKPRGAHPVSVDGQ